MRYKKLLYAGIAFLLLSIVVGIFGTVWGIYSSFDALEKAENAGIGPVGAGIENALIFSVIGVIGSAIGIALLGVGVVKSYRKSNTASTSTSD